MASIFAKSSGTSLTSNFYLQNFYKHNRNAYKASARNDYTKTELSYEDSRALKRAARELASYEYSGEENGSNIVNNIKAFVETYNNTLSSSNTKGTDAYRYNKQLQRLTKEYEDEFKDIGITIKKDGTLSISENILEGASYKEVKKIFSKEEKYTNRLHSIAKRMNSNSYDEIYTQLTGNGGHLNITL